MHVGDTVEGLERQGAYLIIDWPEECIRFLGFSSDSTCQHVFSGITETVLDQNPGHIFHLSQDG